MARPYRFLNKYIPKNHVRVCLITQDDRGVKKILTPKKIAERFFLASTVRVCLITQDDRGVKKLFLRQKKSRSDFFWRRPLGCVLKETYAEGGKKRLVTCVDKESFLFEKIYPTRNLPYPFPYPIKFEVCRPVSTSAASPLSGSVRLVQLGMIPVLRAGG